MWSRHALSRIRLLASAGCVAIGWVVVEKSIFAQCGCAGSRNGGSRDGTVCEFAEVNTKDFGTTGEASGENAQPRFARALAVLPLGQTTRINVGQYRFDISGVNARGPIELIGEGAGAGPGAVLNDHCSQILPNYAKGDAVRVGPSLFGSTFRDFQINSNVGQRTSGAGIRLDATGLNSVVMNYRIENVAFNNQFYDIQTQQGGMGTIENTYHQAWRQDAIHSAGDGIHEGQSGFVTANVFFGDTSASNSQNSGIYTQNGYGRFFNNLILGAQVGVRNYTAEFPNGGFEVVSNWLEEQDQSGVYMFQGNGQTATLAAINWNEFSVATLGGAARRNFRSHITIGPGTPAYWLTDFQIVGNRMRTTAASGGTNAFIQVRGGQYGIVQDNVLEGLGGNTTNGITVGGAANAANIAILDNQVHGDFTNRYSIANSTVMFRDFSSNLTAAEITALTVHDGSLAWAEDGRPGSNPLRGGGPGCIAIREGGVWKGKAPQTSVKRTNLTSYTVVDTDTSLSFYGGATASIRLPTPSSYIGRELIVKTEGGVRTVSASLNVIPLTGGTTPGTAILQAVPGKWVMLKSDGANWVVMMGN